MHSLQNTTLLSSSTETDPPFVWVPSSTTRGTLQILSLCASTTLICIWSAVHRDIPSRRLTGLHPYALQATWVFAAFFLPEFVFAHALKQLLRARSLVTKFSKNRDVTHWLSFWRRREGEADNFNGDGTSMDKEALIIHDVKCQSFTLAHAFYTIMGGYAFDVDAPTAETGDNERIRAIIGPTGVQFLMEHDPELCPDFSPSSIAARSNSNGLNKALLILQLLWFCTSCVSRIASRLPLTLLEVVTAAHGLCTLATYAAWWHKPLNVEEPTLIMGEHAREAYALYRMIQRDDIELLREASRTVSSVDVQPDSQTELALALRATLRYGISDTDLQSLMDDPRLVVLPTESRSMIKNATDLINGLLSPISSGKSYAPSVVAMMSLTAVYGSVHLFGWNSQFPTQVERILWRIATVSICSSGTNFIVFSLLFAFLGGFAEAILHWDVGDFVKIFWAYCIIPFTILLYLLGDLYLLVESIRQLFYLPSEAFVTASWSNYFPHFS
ncbi:hypothetical protein SCHPADRAFT_858427 [Schizopora paradoxa]|uniref:Uncharacterized protein n=1 Tax=Schizopora paradoxa TaxID=27342 RepID=A0A0H2RAV1_9AGAM|nr:hypothetical protein SCHPADRAFT_858427 [Schizopora paradoxa]